LDLLAPGAVITAAGSSYLGTSQAAPHVAGAWACAEAAGLSNILQAMQASGDPVTDTRPSGGRTTSRINMLPEPGSVPALAIGVLFVASLALKIRRSAARRLDTD